MNQANAQETASKKIFVVLGMARSGTSVISRGLKALGIDLGDKLTPGNSAWNPTGFWEDNEIVYKVNARILAALNRTWESLMWLDTHSMPNDQLAPIKKLAMQLLQQRFISTSTWGFKDPNTAKVLPFWQDVFKTLQLADYYIIALRNPLSSARSYHTLTGIDIEHGLFLWLTHMIAAIENTQDKPRILVSYDGVMKNPRQQLERIKHAFSLQVPMDEPDIHYYANDFLDNTLTHYKDSYEDLFIHPAMAVLPLCLKIYDHLCRVASDELTLRGDAFARTWLEIKNDYKKMLPLYTYVNTLLQRNLALKKSISSLQKSRLWKIIYPLRVIDETLRARRKRLKQKKVTAMYES